jgi:nucleotide-binding universal stress UspA family protein
MTENTTPDRSGGIIAAVDFSAESEHALTWAARLAAQRDCELRLIHAVAWSFTADLLVTLGDVAEAQLIDEARARLEKLAEPLRARVRSVVHDAVLGPATRVILDQAAAHHADLLVLGTRGLRGWPHLLLGSTAERVISAARCPVLAVHGHDAMPPEPPERPWRLLAATDGSPEAAAAIRAAVAVLAPAATEISLLRAFEASPLFYPGIDGISAHEVFEAARDAVEDELDVDTRALAGEGIHARALLRDGFAPDVIVAAASEMNADLVVMGTRGRGGLSHLLMGSTAERVAQRAAVPVLVVPRRVDQAQQPPAKAADALAGVVV